MQPLGNCGTATNQSRWTETHRTRAGTPASDGGAPFRGIAAYVPAAPPSVYLLEARRHAPAAGLHDPVVPAHVLADLPVLLPPLLPAGQHRRVAEERRNTVTGQSAKKGGQRGEVGVGVVVGGRERSVSSLASQQRNDGVMTGRGEQIRTEV